MSEIYYKPLTHDLRNQINTSINNTVSELNACEQTAWVNMYKTSYKALATLIKGLPDGYPIPFRKEG